MNFSVTINGRVFTQADFAGFAYIQGLPDSVEKMGEVAELGGTIAVNIAAPAEGATVTRTLPTNLPIKEGEFLLFFNTSTVDERTFATVLSYDSGTGAASLRFDKHIGVVATDVLNRMALSPGTRAEATPTLSQRGFGYNEASRALNGAPRIYSPNYGMQELNFQADCAPENVTVDFFTAATSIIAPFCPVIAGVGPAMAVIRPDSTVFSAGAYEKLSPSLRMEPLSPSPSIGVYHGNTGYYSPAKSGPAIFTAVVGHAPDTAGPTITELGLAPRLGNENPFSGTQIGFYFGQGPSGFGWYAVIRGRTISRAQFLGVTGLEPVFVALYVNPRGDEVHWYITQDGALSALKTPTYSLELNQFFGSRTAQVDDLLFAPAMNVRRGASGNIKAYLSSMTFSVALNRN